MEGEYALHDVVWAKVRGYPWWPAEIAKLPTPDQLFYKVVFIAEDNYANMQPRDIKPYAKHHPDFSKKKMKNLAHAIATADEIVRRRQLNPHANKDLLPDIEPLQKPKPRRNYHKGKQNKAIRKAPTRKRKKEEEEEEESEQEEQEEQSHESPAEQEAVEEEPSAMMLRGQNSSDIVFKGISEELGAKELSFEGRASEEVNKSRSQLGYSRLEMESSDEERWNESEEKVDRGKIEGIEKNLQRLIDEIKQSRFEFSRASFAQTVHLTGQELLQSKITNKINFIIGHMRKESTEAETAWLVEVQRQLKERVVDYLYDTSYYDNCLRVIERNRRAKKECEMKVLEYLEGGYKMKHELAVLMAGRLVQEIAMFDPERERELLNDMREGRLELGKVNNKAATERAIEALVGQYSGQ